MTDTHDNLPAPHATDDAWLEDLLLADGVAQRAATIDDAGFAERVVAALPAASALPAWRRPIVTALWGVAIMALVLAMPSLFVEMLRTVNRLLAEQPFSLAGVGIALVVLLALTSGAAAYSLREND